MCQLFPSEYVHIGGDEVLKNRWKECPDCQQRMRQENLHTEDQLQSWFIQRISRFLHARGKKLIGWDEILEGIASGVEWRVAWRGVAWRGVAWRGVIAILFHLNNCAFTCLYRWPGTKCDRSVVAWIRRRLGGGHAGTRRHRQPHQSLLL